MNVFSPKNFVSFCYNPKGFPFWTSASLGIISSQLEVDEILQ